MASKDDDLLNFINIQEIRIHNFYKKLVEYNSMPKETQKHLKPVGTRSGMHGFCKVHKILLMAYRSSDRFYKYLQRSLQSP